MQNKLRTLVVLIAAVVLAIGTYLAYEKFTRRSHVITMVRDAGARLQTVLKTQLSANAPADLETHATAIEGYSSTLRRMNTSSFTALADAADDYLVTSREIARRAVAIQGARSAVDVSAAALRDHMRADRGAATWTGEAVQLKQSLDSAVREYRQNVEAYGALLASFPPSQLKVLSFVDGLPLIDDTVVKTARGKALDAYSAAEQNAKQVADLGAYRARR